MSVLVDRITAVLRRDGWTCEYHEPVSAPGQCSQCDDAHRHTAERVAETLNLTEEQRTIGGIWTGINYANVNERRWVSPWAAVEGKP